MPRKPKLCHHKATNQAYVTDNGRERYLGVWGTPEADEAYDAFMLDWRRLHGQGDCKGRGHSDPLWCGSYL